MEKGSKEDHAPIEARDVTGRPLRYHDAPRFTDGPIDITTVVSGEGPIELEIGFGRGRFLLERARAAPASRIVGIEIKRKWAWIVEHRRVAEGLSNARAFAGDVRDALARMGPDGSLARVFVHFPDPWWKKRHAKRAVVNDRLLLDVARLLAPGSGELFIQTDVADRAESFRARIDALPAFENVGGEQGFVDSNPFGARSGREARCEADGLPIYRMLFRRR